MLKRLLHLLKTLCNLLFIVFLYIPLGILFILSAIYWVCTGNNILFKLMDKFDNYINSLK